MCKVVAYYRVSTEGQGRSGLGLEAQQHAVTALCGQRGREIKAEFTEIESGKRDDRPELLAALRRGRSASHCQAGPPLAQRGLPSGPTG